jgi:hypothetical protein
MALKVMLWTGGDAPDRNAVLKVDSDYSNEFYALWEPGYCGCEDCSPIVGHGSTEAEAIENYWERWKDRYEN